MNQVHAPFTPEQVASLNAFQSDGRMHDFTCCNPHSGSRSLIATETGWICARCDYTQTWAYDWMADLSWKVMMDEMWSGL
jgi:hypothetical protein